MEVVGGAADVKIDLPAREVVMDVAERLVVRAGAKLAVLRRQAPLVVKVGVLHVACAKVPP